MLPENRKHIRSVVLYGGVAALGAAGLSLIKFPPLVATSIVIGAVLSAANIYAIVLVAEALTSAARAGAAPGGAAKAITGVIYMVKLAVIAVVLIVLVVYRLADLIALMAGFTVVLVAHVLVGMGRFSAGPEGGQRG